MQADRFERLEAIFSEALLRKGAARTTYLDAACGDDAELRRRVASLLTHADTSGGFIRDAIDKLDIELRADREALPGSTIGNYRTIRELGHGGMGEVWLAEQTAPVRREVALKLIKPGMDTREVIARFEAERQALAMMQHPAVARVFDAGATPAGRPFFVMEHVEGLPITQHCNEHGLDTRKRLELFIRVCEGVQHAHQKAIIHRDLKPSNVLVAVHDSRARPKIIDFGVAKAVDQRLTEHSMYTRQGVMIGTPEYMSPEQADMNGSDVDTRTDVYSLGAILYELLVGVQPFDSGSLRLASVEEIRKRIREEEPSKPSARLISLGGGSADAAADRSADRPTLARQLRGDLDWITMKALEKDRDRRYGSAMELADDLRRYLNGEPVTAGPPSASYRTRKFVRRHLFGVATAAAIVAALLAGVIGVGGMAYVARRERAAAEIAKVTAEGEARKATAVTDFLTRMLYRASPQVGDPSDITVREVLDESSDKLESSELGEPVVEAAVRNVIGLVYRELGEYDRAERHLKKVVELREDHHGGGHLETVQARHKVGTLLMARGDAEAAERILRAAVADYRGLLQAADGGDARKAVEEELAAGLNDLGTVLTNTGHSREAVAVFEELRELDRRIFGAQSDTYAIGLYNLAVLYDTIGEYDDEERLVTEALGIYSANHPEDNANTAYYLDTLGLLAQRKGDWQTAQSHHLRALELRRDWFGEEHTMTAFTMGNLAQALHLEGEYEESAALYEKALRIQKATQGETNPKVAYELHRLGRLRQDTGALDEAERLYRQAIAISNAGAGPRHPHAATHLHSLGRLREQRGDLGGAERAFRDALAIRREVLPEGNPEIRESLLSLGRLLTRTDRALEAEQLLRECWEAQKAMPPSVYRDPAEAERAYAEALRALGRNDLAASL